MSKFDKIHGMLVYVCVHEPRPALVKPGAPKKPDEWKASVVLTDEDFVDELEDYAKSLETMISLKKVKTAEFENLYKVAPPKDAGKNVWVFTLRKSTELGKTGKPVPELYQPKVYLKEGNVISDITHTKLVGNGSMGAIAVDRFDRSTGGSSLFLKSVLVTDLIEYEQQSSPQFKPGSEWDDSTDDGDGGSVKVPTKAKVTTTSKAKKASTGFEDMDDDIPF